MAHLDPVMAAVCSALFLPFPLQQLYFNLREMLEMSPLPAMRQKIENAVRHIEQRYQVRETQVYTSKVGPIIFVDLYLIVDHSASIRDVRDLDSIRQQLQRWFTKLPYEVRFTVTMIQERKWVM